jgi:hypothetical protein
VSVPCGEAEKETAAEKNKDPSATSPGSSWPRATKSTYALYVQAVHPQARQAAQAE